MFGFDDDADFASQDSATYACSRDGSWRSSSTNLTCAYVDYTQYYTSYQGYKSDSDSVQVSFTLAATGESYSSSRYYQSFCDCATEASFLAVVGELCKEQSDGACAGFNYFSGASDPNVIFKGAATRVSAGTRTHFFELEQLFSVTLSPAASRRRSLTTAASLPNLKSFGAEAKPLSEWQDYTASYLTDALSGAGIAYVTRIDVASEAMTAEFMLVANPDRTEDSAAALGKFADQRAMAGLLAAASGTACSPLFHRRALRELLASTRPAPPSRRVRFT